MKIFFCSDPLDDKAVDFDYEAEYKAAEELGLKVHLISLEDLLDGNASKAIKRIPASTMAEAAMYRGWMIRPEIYEQLYNALKFKNVVLINSPEEYMRCHYFPYAYETIKAVTPLSVWLDIHDIGEDFGSVYEKIQVFGNKPILIKDYVKSRKHEWNEACFIPDASDKYQVEYVLKNFIERQGQELNGGIVFREFIALEHLSKHPKSGMPLSNEYRLFFLNQKLLSSAEYWEEASYQNGMPRLDLFIELAKNINSHFFTMDIARTTSGDWLVIEVGDGQVSGIPSHANIRPFYRSIKELMN